MKRKLTYVLGALLFVVFYTACVKKKDYPRIPEIEFNEFIPFEGDSADFSVKFYDGDGNIGAGSSDTTKNFYVVYYYKDTITNKYVAYFDPVLNDTLRTGYIVRKPSDAYLGKPISGEINVRMQKYRHSKKIKHVRYVTYLFDAAGNKSNVVVSPEFQVP